MCVCVRVCVCVAIVRAVDLEGYGVAAPLLIGLMRRPTVPVWIVPHTADSLRVSQSARNTPTYQHDGRISGGLISPNREYP